MGQLFRQLGSRRSSDQQGERLPAAPIPVGAERRTDLGGRPSLGLLARGGPAFPLPGPVQRQILLVDRAERHYREAEEGKPASGIGELYFTSQKYQGKPIFTPADPVDQFTRLAGREDDSISDKDYQRNLGLYTGFGRDRGKFQEEYNKWDFYTDDAKVTDTLAFYIKEGAAEGALRMPLLRDPGRKGGFGFRYPDANGFLVSRLTKEETLKQLGLEELPDGVVGRFGVTGPFLHLARKGSFYPENIAAKITYFRSSEAPKLWARGESSRFKSKVSVNTKDEEAALEALADVEEDELPTAHDDTSESISYKGYARKKSRGKGQEDAMSGWNALAYAGYALKQKSINQVNLSQDWEWLHIRGSQNGGPTTPANLVAGTSTTNSRMIPWEDKINAWTEFASPAKPLNVRFEGKRYAGTNLGKEIKFFISAPKGLPGAFDEAIPDESPIEVTFDPLEGRVFDKLSNRLARKATIPERVKETVEATTESEVDD